MLIAAVLVMAGAPWALAIWFFDRVEPRHWLYCFIWSISILVFGGLTAHIVAATAGTDQTYVIGLYFGYLLVAIGWIFTNEISIRNARRQHTINLLTGYFSSKERVEDRRLIAHHLPGNAKITSRHVDYDDDTHPLVQAIDRELNFFEFLAAAIRFRDVDETLARDTLSAFVAVYCDQMKSYIDYYRSKPNGATTWLRLLELNSRWQST